MMTLVIILAWLLLNAYINLIIIACDDHFCGEEWAGMTISCLFSPLACLFIVKPIVKFFKKILKKY